MGHIERWGFFEKKGVLYLAAREGSQNRRGILHIERSGEFKGVKTQGKVFNSRGREAVAGPV